MSSRDRNGVLPSREWRDMRSHDETYNGSPAPVAPASLGSLQSALAQQDPRFGSPTAKLPFSGDAAEPTFTFTSSTSAPGLAKDSSPFALPPLSLPNEDNDALFANFGSTSTLTPSSGSKSPQTTVSGSSVFSAFRSTSPKISLNTSAITRDDTPSMQSPQAQRGISRERDYSQSGSEASVRNRRPSSVFDHVGGMIDKFGRKLQSRTETRDDRRRSSNSASNAALDVTADEAGADHHSSSNNQISPGAKTSGNGHMHSDTTSKDSAGQQSAGALSWSPIVDEGRRRPNIMRNISSGSNHDANEANRSSVASQRSNDRRLSGMDRTLIQITDDNERFSVVDVSGLNSAAAIKERMMSKLHIYDEDPAYFSFSRTEIGRTGSANPIMSDDELLVVCWQAGDEKGTLKFLIHQTSPGQLNHSKRPPPPISPRFSQAVTQVSNEAATSSSARNEHAKAGSLSSRSSMGDGANGESGDNAAEGSSRMAAGGLHRVKANKRLSGTSASLDGGRSPVTSGRSPQSTTPQLPSVSEGIQSSSKIVQAQRSERRNTQSPLYSPSADTYDRDSANQSNSSRRDFSAPRPKSTHDSIDRGSNGHWENEGGIHNARNGHNPISPRLRQSNLQERPSSEIRPSYSPNMAGINNELPRSLQPGGRDPRSVDAADAAHMYLARTSSPGNDAAPYATPSQQSALGIHNTRSMDDMRRRSRMVMPPLSEMPTHRGEQHPSRSTFNEGPSSGQRHIDAQGHSGPQRMVPSHPSGSQGMQDPRQQSGFSGGIPARARASLGSEIDRRGGPPYTVPSTPYPQQSPSMSRPQFENVRSGPPTPRPNVMTSPQMVRPMTPHSLQPHSYDTRYSNSAPFNNTQSPRPPHLSSDFGARMQSPSRPLHAPPLDPRITRPHSVVNNEPSRYRPIPAPPSLQPRSSIPPPHREDHFIATHFPASSSRVVSEFQRNPNSALQPGMTVQETMQKQRQQQAALQAQYTNPSRGPDPRALHSRPPPPPQSFASRPPPPTMNQQQQQQQYHNHQQPSQQSHQSQIPVSQHQSHNIRPVPSSSSARQQPSRPPAALIPARPHTSAADETNRPSVERSSGSSFASSTDTSSHGRNFSSEDRRPNSRYIEETYSAPTSARSSRSESVTKDVGRPQVSTGADISASEVYSPASDSELPYSTRSDRRGSLEDEELLHLRPLPKVPMTGRENDKIVQRRSKEMKEGKDKDEDTFRATDWQHMLDALEADASRDDDGSGTAKMPSRNNLLSPKRSEADESESSSNSQNTAVPSTQYNVPSRELENLEEENGTFASFASFDDDDSYDEGGTWAKPLDNVPVKNSSKEEENKRASDDGTLRPGGAVMQGLATIQELDNRRSSSPRRPVLTLSIDSNVHGGAIPPVGSGISPKSQAISQSHLQPISSTDSQSSGSGPSLSAPSPASSGLNRRTSFARRDADWAFRPPPEQLYDNLDAFFPKHDLDKPVLETGAAIPGSPQVESPASDAPIASPVAPLMSNMSKGRFQHKKSIRIVAQDRKKFMEKSDAAERRKAEVEGQGLSRRRSTKLWGTRVVEVTSSSASASSSSSESPQSDPNAKPTFKWVKGDLIGKGTYGRVYLALNATTGEMIAVKQVELPRTDSDREDARQKGVVAALKSEIETLKDLDHPNIVSYLGFEETTSYLSIFLEYVPGGSVGSCLRKHGKLDEATLKSFLQQILAGLNYLHNRGILHRDLKADNLLVDFNGIVKISDFGTVRKSEDIYGNIASMSIQGSIFWMAPEVVSLSRAGYSAKVDIWSLGCVVLEMFAGRRPWSDEEAVQAMFKIGAERRAPPIPPDVRLSRAAAHFLKTCFAVDPNARPTAQRLLEHVFPHVMPGWSFSESNLYRALHR